MGKLVDVDDIKKMYPIMENDFGMVVNDRLHENLDKIPPAEAILKTDVVAMLTEIQNEIEENVLADDPNTLLPFLQARETCVAVIQQKINEFGGKENG